MRAFVVTAPRATCVLDVDEPVAGPGDVVVEIDRVGVCGTDVEFFTGDMEYLRTGHASYPIRLGHEWSGRVVALGDGVDPAWRGRRATGDTMLGCGKCRRCRSGLPHVCEDRYELGIRGGFPGALAERMAYPARWLHPLPDAVDDVAGAMVEPGGNALRSVEAARIRSGDRVLVAGPGTIGLLVALFARARGAEVHLLGRSERTRRFAAGLGFAGVWTRDGAAAGSMGCGHRRVDLPRDPVAGRRAGRARPDRGVRRPGHHADAHRLTRPAAQGRHRDGDPGRVPGPGRDHRGIRRRVCRPTAARGGHGRARGRRCGARRAATGRRRRRAQDPRRPAPVGRCGRLLRSRSSSPGHPCRSGRVLHRDPL